MWFKNLRLLQFKDAFAYEPEQLAEQLATTEFQPCPKHLPTSLGWVSPLEQPDAPLVYGGNGFMLLCLKSEERVLPAAVLREKVAEKVAEIQQKEDRKVGRKERQNLREDIYQTLLPQAFTQSTRLQGYIDTQEKLLVIDATSDKQVELFCNFLRKSLGSLKVTVPEVQTVNTVITSWLRDQKSPTEFTIEEQCVLTDLRREGGTIRAQRQDLFSSHIQNFLNSHYTVSQLALSWQEQVQFNLHDDFGIKSLKFLPDILEARAETFAETEAERFTTDFVLMSETLRHFLRSLLQVFARQTAAQAEPADAELAAV